MGKEETDTCNHNNSASRVGLIRTQSMRMKRKWASGRVFKTEGARDRIRTEGKVPLGHRGRYRYHGHSDR